MFLGKTAQGRVVKTINSVDENGYVYPLNLVQIKGYKNRYAFVMGVTHTVCNFDGRIIAALVPKDPENTDLKTIWIMASRSSRYINQDIYQYIDVKNDFPEYELVCYYESSAGAVVYRSIKGKLRFLLIKNKRSANWVKQNTTQQEEKFLKKRGFTLKFISATRVYQNIRFAIMLTKKFLYSLQRQTI